MGSKKLNWAKLGIPEAIVEQRSQEDVAHLTLVQPPAGLVNRTIQLCVDMLGEQQMRSLAMLAKTNGAVPRGELFPSRLWNSPVANKSPRPLRDIDVDLLNGEFRVAYRAQSICCLLAEPLSLSSIASGSKVLSQEKIQYVMYVQDKGLAREPATLLAQKLGGNLSLEFLSVKDCLKRYRRYESAFED